MEVQVLDSGNAAAVDAGRVRVLVVDDCQQLLEVVTEVLRVHGFQVLAAPSAAEALELLHEQRPDIILCDVMMPEVDGFKFNAEVRENPEWNDIPFIFLSALSEPDDVRFGKSLGCDDYLTKPFDPLDLVSTIRGKLSLAEVRQKKAEEKLEKYRRRVIYTLSHEFRTPLVAINTGTELLLDQLTQNDREHFRKLLESVHRGGMRLQRLVEDFMTLQQIDSGAAAATALRLRRKLNLATVVENTVESFRESANDEKLMFEFIAPAEDAPQLVIRACEVHVANIVQRILSNAHKFGPSGKVITVEVKRAGASAQVIIRDRGPGMSERAFEEATKLFSQIDREKYEQQGCGLGLTISSYYASVNGGTLTLQKPNDENGLEVVLAFQLES